MKKLLYIGSSILFATALSAAPCTDEAAKIALNTWGQSVASLNPTSAATTAYVENATLMGTVAKDSVSSVAGRENYFKHFIGTNKAVNVAWNTINVVNYEGSSVVSGLYTFTLTNDQNQTSSIAARYTFALENTQAGCKIIEHHSSAVPANAFDASVNTTAVNETNGAAAPASNAAATPAPANAANSTAPAARPTVPAPAGR
ncbi:MAG: hypothetical protein FWE18_06265 [Alphaproteobacteria bacterium]|nr:hypothetical protein [Alphaproteobacteria bacterium]